EDVKRLSAVGIDRVPLGLFLNAPAAFAYPDTTWGARAKFQPSSRFYTMVGAYNGDPTLKNGTHHGLDFSMRGPPFVIGEVGFRKDYPNVPSGSSRNIKLGGYYNGEATPFDSGVSGRPSATKRRRYPFSALRHQP